jgi:hypothetical protein
MKMDRQLPDRRPILIATKAMLFMGQDTSSGLPYPECSLPPRHSLLAGVLYALSPAE